MFEQMLYEPAAGREPSKEQVDRLRESEMAAFESLSKQL
jgi:hypothetical protein